MIEKWVARGWLAGFVDGEGCIYYRERLRNGKPAKLRLITIGNTNRALLDFAAQCMDCLGIEHSGVMPSGKTTAGNQVFTLEIRRGSALERFREQVPIQCTHKRETLDTALASYNGLRCKECKCLHDEYTHGCHTCDKRHQWRKYNQLRGATSRIRVPGNRYIPALGTPEEAP